MQQMASPLLVLHTMRCHYPGWSEEEQTIVVNNSLLVDNFIADLIPFTALDSTLEPKRKHKTKP